MKEVDSDGGKTKELQAVLWRQRSGVPTNPNQTTKTFFSTEHLLAGREKKN